MATSTARKTAPSRKSPAPAARRKSPATRPAASPATAPKRPGALSKPATPAPMPAAAKSPNTLTQEGAAEPKKVKLVRDSFTIPKVEYGVIDVLKTRAERLGRPAKKSEVVRAGLKALISMTDADFLACVASLPAAKAARTARS